MKVQRKASFLWVMVINIRFIVKVGIRLKLNFCSLIIAVFLLRNAYIFGKTLFLGMSLRMFLEEISSWFSRLSKEMSPHQWVGIIIIQSFESLPTPTLLPQKKGKERESSLSLLELGHPSSLALIHQILWNPGLNTSGPLVLRPLASHWIIP